MRGSKMNGRIGGIRSSFLSCEKDLEAIVQKLFVENRPYSDLLKRLLIINTKDCLTSMENPYYNERVRHTSVKDLKDKGYIKFSPRMEFGENEEVKSYLIFSFDNFTPSATNGYFRDCIIEIDIICQNGQWELDDYKLRPLKIAGYIDGLLNNERFSGLGRLNFLGCNELVLTPELSGYCLMYSAVHGADDEIPELE